MLSKKLNPLVSVMINCFNGEKYLTQAIESIFKQTYENWEIIFWDNQSTDKSREIIESFNSDKIKYFYAVKHTNLYSARNYAIAKTKGSYLTFLDCDDWWHPDKLILQIKALMNNDIAMAYTNFHIVSERSRFFIPNTKRIAYNKKLPSGNILDSILDRYNVGLLTIMIKKEYFTLFDERFQIIGDMDLVVRISATQKIIAINKPLAFYRIHADNTMLKLQEQQIKEYELWYVEMQQHPIIARSKQFTKIKYLIMFLKSLSKIRNYKFLYAIGTLIILPFDHLKFKLLVYLIIPHFVMKLLK